MLPASISSCELFVAFVLADVDKKHALLVIGRCNHFRFEVETLELELEL